VRHPVILIALHEFTINRRNKWVISFAGLFTFLTFFVAYFGMVTSGYAGFQDFTRTSASIINLAGFILPLFALLLGVFSFISDKEYLELLVTQPLSRFQVLLGKYLGLLLTLVGASIVGFGVPGVIISLSIGIEGAILYTAVVFSSIILGIIFLGISLLITFVSDRRQIELGVSIGVWLYFELVYGLVMMGTTLYFSHTTLKSILLFGLFGNPVDLARVLSLLVVGGPYFFGAAGATLIKMTGSTMFAVLLGSSGLLIWMVLPLAVSNWLFAKRNL